MVNKTIAIDGPAGAGKSTVARLVAEKLGYLYIDTGAMYRALTYKAMSLGISLREEKELTSLAGQTEIKLVRNGKENMVYCDGKDISEEIRSPEISQNVSLIALVPGVRRRMVELQRNMGRTGGVVMDGRDICTQVLPEADCKFFLTASVDERALRRYKEMRERGFDTTIEQVEKDLTFRDKIDQEREVSPLVCASDAYVIDSTHLSIEDVVDKIILYCESR